MPHFSGHPKPRRRQKTDIGNLPWTNNSILAGRPTAGTYGTVKQDKHRSFCLHGNQQIKSKKGMMKRLDHGPNYEGMDADINPDHDAMKGGKLFDVDKDIEINKRIDPAKVFENYTVLQTAATPKKTSDKKVRTMPKAMDMKVGGRNVTIKYSI